MKKVIRYKRFSGSFEDDFKVKTVKIESGLKNKVIVSEILDKNDEMYRHKSGLLDSKKEYNDIATKKNESNIDYKLDDTGRGVIQIHFMGIEQLEVDALKHVSAEASGASLDKLRMLLVGAVGQKGCHLDMRLVRTGDNYFEGGEFQPGNFSGLIKVKEFVSGGKKLRFDWKSDQKEDVKGPVTWLDMGSDGFTIFKPGESGATVNTYGAILRLDTFTWKLVQADNHAKKFELTGSKLLGDRKTLLVDYVPVSADERVWMASLMDTVIQKSITIIPISKQDLQIVTGVVYEPDETDSQGDTTTADEIQQACYFYMENQGQLKMNHKGEPIDAIVVENFIAPQNLVIEGRPIKKGTWLMSVKINDAAIWKDIKDGNLTGFSMAGFAQGELC